MDVLFLRESGSPFCSTFLFRNKLHCGQWGLLPARVAEGIRFMYAQVINLVHLAISGLGHQMLTGSLYGKTFHSFMPVVMLVVYIKVVEGSLGDFFSLSSLPIVLLGNKGLAHMGLGSRISLLLLPPTISPAGIRR